MVPTKQQIREKKHSLAREVEDIIDHLENVLHEASCDFMYTHDLQAGIERLREWTLIEEDGENYYT